ncbi:Hypothetical predicted protein [Octopus vulgaris]|uniref:Uncharacterized protein n=1 Tax=Octopus vulgaris TaxID=6645 RepID=A0AA36BW68_OCTVU|nr:Hypothetical predicted protein [Octopus vulgaris]
MSSDIPALSKTRLVDTGELQVGNGRTIFEAESRQARQELMGVGFAIKLTLIRQLPSIHQAVDEHLMTFRIPISNSSVMHIISAYAPTLSASEQEHNISTLNCKLVSVTFHIVTGSY